MNPVFSLLTSRRLLPLLLIQSLSAGADVLFKTAATMMAVYAAGATATEGGLVPAMVWGLFMAPYVLFAGLAGQIADKFEKAWLTRRLKLFELAVMGLAAAGFLARSIPVLLLAIFLKGASNAVFSPVKYAALPEHLTKPEIPLGYSLIEAGAFIACVLGALGGTLLAPTQGGGATTALCLGLLGLAAVLCAARLPVGSAAAPQLRLDAHLLRPLGGMFALLREDRILLQVIVGRSLFWLTGALFLAEIPAVTRNVLGGAPEVVALLFVLFSVGLSVGMVACAKVAGAEDAVRHVWIPGLLISGLTLDLCLTAAALPAPTGLQSLAEFLADPSRLRITADLALIPILSGVFVVPLGVSLQTRPAAETRARLVSVDNAISSLVMAMSMAAVGLAVSAGASLLAVFAAFAVLNAAVCVHLRLALRRLAVPA